MDRFTTDPICPKCGEVMCLEDKNTFTGREFREYRCPACGELVVEDRGVALWQVLHDANMERAELERRRAERPWWKFWKK